jgi:hypothetical protein
MSMIALVFTRRTGQIAYATLRWNHEKAPVTPEGARETDHAIKTNEELELLIGKNFMDYIQKTIKNFDEERLENFWDNLRNSSEYVLNTWNNNEFRELPWKLPIKIPSFIDEIEDRVFEDCNFEEIELPEDLEKIGAGAFSGCDRLTKLVIPEKVEEIGEDAFEGMEDLDDLYFKGKTIDQVRDMDNYPWGLANPLDIIRAEYDEEP